VGLTDLQKSIQVRLLNIAWKKNDKGQGYVLGDGYNTNWHKVRDILVEKEVLVKKSGEKGFWVK
jgi:hypothetical protein